MPSTENREALKQMVNGGSRGRSPHRRSNRAAIFASLRWLLLCLAVLTFTACKRAPYSSPTALRDTNAYAKAISPAPPTTADPGSLDRFTVAMEGDVLSVTSPSSSASESSSDGAGHVVTRLAPGQKLIGDGATFELVAFSVSGPGIGRKSAGEERIGPLEFFAPDGRPLSPGDLKALWVKEWETSQYRYSSFSFISDAFPRVQAWFGSRQSPPGYCSPVGFFDARTKQSLASGRSYSQVTTNSYGYTESRIQAWHATPLELVVDVHLDGKSVVETIAIPGLTVPVAGGVVRLLGIWEGNSSSWGSSWRSSSGSQTTRTTLSRKENQTNAVALFVTDPPRLAVQCELLDEQGRKLEGGAGGGTSSNGRLVGFRGRAADVRSMRLTVYTNHHCVVLTLPPLPNLPSAGIPVANLFEVPVPAMRIQSEVELREVVGKLTQMRFAYPPGGDLMPANLFPMMLTNVTANDLLAIYSRHLTNGSTVLVDEQKLEIRVEPSTLEKVRRWARQKLRL